jgi:hypothetical protein
VGESGPRTHNRACPTKPEKKMQPDCPCDALKFNNSIIWCANDARNLACKANITVR